MKSFSNECGARNSFGYYDSRAKEIVLKRPCPKKADLEEVYEWLENNSDLKKFSIGIGATENFVAGNAENNLYTTARGIVKNTITKSQYSDSEMLRGILLKLKQKKMLRNLSIKCFIFYDDSVLFDLLLETISSFDNLIFLDLTGCYFSDEQLLDLSTVTTRARVAHLIWPEPRMDKMVLAKATRIIETNKALVIIRGVPLEMQKVATKNREDLFALGKRPSMIGEEEIELIKQYKASIRLAIAFEKDKLLNLEKTFEAILADPDPDDGNAIANVLPVFNQENDDDDDDDCMGEKVTIKKMEPTLGHPHRGRGRPPRDPKGRK